MASGFLILTASLCWLASVVSTGMTVETLELTGVGLLSFSEAAHSLNSDELDRQLGADGGPSASNPAASSAVPAQSVSPTKSITVPSSGQRRRLQAVASSGSTLTSSNGVNFNLYYQYQTWAGAASACRSSGQTLAWFSSQEEFNELVTKIVNSGVKGQFWIGYTDSGTDGVWQTVEGTVPAFTSWADDEPGVAEGFNCAQIWSAQNYFWSDALCDSANYYVCRPGVSGQYTLVSGIVFQYIPVQTYWDDADSVCSSRGGDLAWFSTPRQFTIVYNHLLKPTRDVSWLGYTDSEAAGTWRTSVGSVAPFLKWESGFPRSGYGDCVQVVQIKQLGFWENSDCGMLLSFVCRYRNGALSPSPSPVPPPPPVSPTNSPPIAPVFQCTGCIGLGDGFVCARRVSGMAGCSEGTELPATFGIAQIVTGMSRTGLGVILSDTQFVAAGFLGGSPLPNAKALVNVSEAAVGQDVACVVFLNNTASCYQSGAPVVLELWGFQQTVVQDVQQISVGLGFYCVLNMSRQPSCIGTTYAESIPEDFQDDVASISAGGYHVCAIKINGTAGCWGQNTYGQLNVPADVTDVRSISAGYTHVCAISGAARVPSCWGGGGAIIAAPPSYRSGLAAIVAGFSQTCAVSITGDTICWHLQSANTTVQLPLEYRNLVQPLALYDNLMQLCSVPFCLECSKTSQSVCAQCGDGYYLIAGQCAICPDGCFACEYSASGQPQCSVCMAGFWFNKARSTCEDCKINACDTCIKSGPNYTCTQCAKGFQLRDNACVSGSYGCPANTYPASIQCNSNSQNGACSSSKSVLQGASNLCISAQQCRIMYNACLTDPNTCEDCCLQIQATAGTWYLLRFQDYTLQCDPPWWWGWSWGK